MTHRALTAGTMAAGFVATALVWWDVRGLMVIPGLSLAQNWVIFVAPAALVIGVLLTPRWPGYAARAFGLGAAVWIIACYQLELPALAWAASGLAWAASFGAIWICKPKSAPRD